MTKVKTLSSRKSILGNVLTVSRLKEGTLAKPGFSTDTTLTSESAVPHCRGGGTGEGGGAWGGGGGKWGGGGRRRAPVFSRVRALKVLFERVW